MRTVKTLCLAFAIAICLNIAVWAAIPAERLPSDVCPKAVGAHITREGAVKCLIIYFEDDSTQKLCKGKG